MPSEPRARKNRKHPADSRCAARDRARCYTSSLDAERFGRCRTMRFTTSRACAFVSRLRHYARAIEEAEELGELHHLRTAVLAAPLDERIYFAAAGGFVSAGVREL